MAEYLYHGSDHIVRRPLFHGGKPYNDYGYGFYCTRNLEMAKEWAVSDLHDGFANCYEIDMTGLKILELNKDHSILTWLAVLLRNRTFNIDTPLGKEGFEYIQSSFGIDTEPYDIICGYRADDSYFSFAQDFINGAISYQQLKTAMYLGDLGTQVVLVSREAFSRIRYIRAETAMRTEYLAIKKERDRKACTDYLDSDRMRYRRGDLYIISILEQEIKPGDPRLK